MPSKKKKYNARFPAGRIKKIMQTDEEVGKVAQAVPVIISRTLELFVESLLTKAMEITSAKNAKTLSPSHMKQCILSESRFDFLKELVANIPDVANSDVEEPSGPPVTSPSRGINFQNFPDDVSPSLRRHSEGTSRTPAVAPVPVPVPVPVPATVMAVPPEDTRPTSLLSLAANSTRIHANFYKESDEAHEGAVACALPPENNQLSSAMQNMTPFATKYPQINTSYDIDEDYDTT